MANTHVLSLVIFSLISVSLQDVANNQIDEQEESPLADIAKEILKEKNLENIGGMVNSFIQSGGAKTLMDGVLQNLATKENAGQLLEGLGNILNSAGSDSGGTKERKVKKTNDEINPMDLLSGLGSIMGAIQGAGGNDGQANSEALLQGIGSILGGLNAAGGNNGGAALLQGLGSILANANGGNNGDNTGAGAMLQGLGSILGGAAAADGQEEGAGALLKGLGSLFEGQGGLEPQMIGNMINMFASAQEEQKHDKPVKSKTPKKASSSEKTKPKKANKSGSDEQPFDLSSLMNLASSFLSNNGKGGKGGSSFLDYLPIIMNTINSFTGPDAKKRADSHSAHSWTMPPILERIHIYFDNFMSSDMGQLATEYISDQKVFKVFQDEKGEFSYKKFKELLENHSFRRHWIQQVTKKLIDFLRIVSDETMQKRYFDMGLTFTNSFLQNSGFPKNALLNMKSPVKSITNFANFAAKKYLDADIDTKEYVEPVVLYTKDLLRMARASLKPGPETQLLTDKLTDTINMEIIEPITRVNRAYRFAKSEPTCDRYVFCIINQDEPSTASLPTIRRNLYKGYSLIASWFLSSKTGTSYWDLFDAIAYQENCQIFHNDSCNRFYEEEVKATTEYIHNEL